MKADHHATIVALLAALLLCAACSSEPELTPEIDVQASSLPACSAPGAPGFDDGLPGSGVVFVHRLFDTAGEVDPFRGAFGAGVVAADLDNDGNIDLFFPQEDGLDDLYWGLGGARFEQAASNHVLRSGAAESWQMYANVADFDGNGLLDLLVTGRGSIRLFRNDGGREFTDVTEMLELQQPPHYPGGAAWGDFDGDADLDLFVGNYGVPESGSQANQNGPEVIPSKLYRNDGAQVFRDVSEYIPWQEGSYGACLQASWRDLDDDGDLDLMQVNDFGPWKGSTMFWENGGAGEGNAWHWTDRLPGSGIGVLEYPMGSSFADFDGDGILDLWLSDIGKNRVLRGLGDWQWLDVGVAWALDVLDQPSDVSWAVVDLDIDGDGRPDVFVNYGPHQPNPPQDPNEPWAEFQADRLLRSNPDEDGNLRFELLEDAFPAPQTGNARGTASADLDGNGVPDLITGNLGGPPSLLLGRCTEASRLVVELRQPGDANVFAIGARVRVEAGGLVQIQELSAGGRGSFSGSQPRLYFGLGGATKVDALSVTWPDGTTHSITDLCPDCKLLLTRGD